MVHTNASSPTSYGSLSEFITALLDKPSEYKDFSTRQNVFTNEEIEVDTENSKVIFHISTPEQFYTIFQVYDDSLNYEFYGLIENNLYFQNDPVFREGFLNAFKNKYTKLIFQPANNSSNMIVIQGIQLTGSNFLYSDSSLLVFNNCYLKDLVFTKTDWVRAFAGQITYNYCNLSIHIRAFEYGYQFDSNEVSWNNCARYIEFSDLVEDSIPSRQEYYIFDGATQNCSTIAKNLAFIIEATYKGPRLISSSVNSSWDIELEVLKYVGNPESSSGNEGSQCLYLGGNGAINNCFISIKTLRRIPEDYYYSKDVQFKSDTTGVNIFNKGNPNQITACTAKQNNQVVQLTDAECHDYATLNRYGFFVNQAYEFELLENEPLNWATNYQDYYRKLGYEYVKIMDVSAPQFTTDTYYRKVLVS